MELLVALAILATVAAIVVPRIYRMKREAQEVVAAQVAAQLNRTLSQWFASGGSAGSSVFTSDILYVLGNPGGCPNVSYGSLLSMFNITNSAESRNIQLNIPKQTLQALPVPGGISSRRLIEMDGVYVYYSPSAKRFTTRTEGSLDDGSWTESGTSYSASVAGAVVTLNVDGESLNFISVEDSAKKYAINSSGNWYKLEQTDSWSFFGITATKYTVSKEN